MESRRFRLGVVGGVRGSFVLMCEELLSDRMEVTALLETDNTCVSKLREEGTLKSHTAVYENFDRFLESGLDAVVLCNFFHQHSEMAIRAMNAGIAVLSETTAAPSLGDCVKLVEAAERTGTKYMLGANCLYFRAVQAMKKCMDEKKYGDIIYADAEYVHPLTPEGIAAGAVSDADAENLHWRRTLPGGLYNMHDLGPLLFMTNSMPRRVIGKSVVVPGVHPKKYVNSMKFFGLVETDSGAVFNYSGCTGAGTLGKWYRIACAKGTVESVRYNEQEDRIIEGDHQATTVRLLSWVDAGVLTPEEAAYYRSDDPEFEKRTHGGIDLVLLIHFIKYLRNEEEPFFDVYRATALSATAIMAWYSALSGSIQLDVPDFRNKADREKFRNDFRHPFAKRYSDITLPCSVREGESFRIEAQTPPEG